MKNNFSHFRYSNPEQLVCLDNLKKCLTYVLLFVSTVSHAHDFGLIGEVAVDWHTEQISRVVASRINDWSDVGGVVTREGKQCLEGSGFSFDVDEQYAFDLDETVELEVEFRLQETTSYIAVKYERNGEAETAKPAKIPAYQSGSRIYKQTFILDRARFANRSLFNTDFSIGPDWAELSSNSGLTNQTITICNISLKRSYTTPMPKAYGRIALEVRDETGRLVPARVGIYDTTGRLPFPSDEAVEVKRLNEMMRVVNVPPAVIAWPTKNRSAFYISGRYHARLPVGQYELVIAKGPEYRTIQTHFVVEKDKQQTLRIDLNRWDDLPAKGWYSGDTHIHYIRNDKSDDPNLLMFTQAEDLHVANNLAVGNVAGVPWPQYGWEPVFDAADKTYSFVPGQEDPRTARLGHTISLHLKNPIRYPEHYFNYRAVFEDAKAQGAVTGYAHIPAHEVGLRVIWSNGAALDVPRKLVDFFEVMQFGFVGTGRWFDFLNLGYKLAPSAGTDYMFDFTLPGAERSYVQVEKPFTLQKWFDGLKRGETFVTNGPMLEFTVNGKPMGSELQLNSGDTITIKAVASINPDIDYLDSLELIEQGEVVKTIKAKNTNETKLTLAYQTIAQHGSWFVIRAKGKQPHQWYDKESAKLALSGAIYVYVDGKSFWKPSEVPAIVQRLKQDMEQIMAPETGIEVQSWWTRESTLRMWESQKAMLKQRIDRVMPIYDELLKRAEAETESQ